MRILVIEDDQELAKTIKEELDKAYVVDSADSGKKGIYCAEVNDYDLIILDLALPDMAGVEIVRKLRNQSITSPILVLTGKNEIQNKVQVLDAGADDYLTKPFSFQELHARTRALMRRSNLSLTNLFVIDGLTVDISTRLVKRDETIVKLRRKEFDLLEYLVRNRGRVVTRDMILEHIWDSDTDMFTNAIDVHVKYLRDAIDRPFGTNLIKTVHGLGYKIE